jgi:hypothetical protein
MDCIEDAVEKCREILRWNINPFNCVYMNPHRYDVITLTRWTQNYCNNRAYMLLLRTAEITGYEPVPTELLHRNIARDGYKNRKVSIGKSAFYLIKPEEMKPGLKKRYKMFKELMKQVKEELMTR